MRRLALVALVVACSGPARPTGPTGVDPRARIVKYAPLGMKADAKLATQAVILGTDTTGGSTVIPLARTGHAKLGTMVVEVGDGALGSKVTPDDAGVWLAAIVTANALGKDPVDFTFGVQVEGTLDGVADSSRIATGFVAALTGAAIDAQPAVTGVLYPDGTIVGGDLYDAYQRATGTALPRPVPVDEDDMALDDDAARALDRSYDAWQRRVALRWSRLLELDAAGRLPATLTQIVVAAREEATAAEKLHTQGLSAAAYDRIATAWVYVTSATTIADVLDAVRARNLESAGAKLVEAAAMASTDDTFLRVIGAATPASISAHLQVLAAYDAALTGLAFATVAPAQVDAAKTDLASLAKLPPATLQSDAVADQVVASVAPAVLAIDRALAGDAIAHDVLALEAAADVSYQTSPRLAQLAGTFRAAATANLARFSSVIAAKTMERPQDATAAPLAALAAGEVSWFHSSAAIAMRDGLGVVDDPITGIPTKVGRDHALAALLAAAERTARANARAAKIATGAIPLEARIAYQTARALRDGDVADKVSALETFWLASLYAQTAVMLARN